MVIILLSPLNQKNTLGRISSYFYEQTYQIICLFLEEKKNTLLDMNQQMLK